MSERLGSKPDPLNSDDTGDTIAPDRRSEKKSLRYRAAQAGAVVLAAIGATIVLGGYQADNWNKKLADFKTDEANLIDKQRLLPNKAQCLGRTLLINSGATVRTTPNSTDFNSILPTASWFDDDNQAFKIKKDEELQVKLPKWSLDTDGNQWVSFKMVNRISNKKITKPGPYKNPMQIASETYWVNYGQLKDATNNEREHYIVEKPLENAPELPTDLVSCEILTDGTTTVNSYPAALGKIYFGGHYDEVDDMRAFPKAA